MIVYKIQLEDGFMELLEKPDLHCETIHRYWTLEGCPEVFEYYDEAVEAGGFGCGPTEHNEVNEVI